MKRILLSFVLLLACRPADGGAHAAPPVGGSAAAVRQPPSDDSAQANQLLERADRDRIQGDTAAPVWILELSDFQCSFCKQWHDKVYPTIVRDYVAKKIVRLAYVNMPLQMHAHALQAADAAMCASAQDKFWPMHDALFATQERWAPMDVPGVTALFDSLAVSVGVIPSAWRDCVKSPAIRRLVDADRARGAAQSVRSTPTFLIGNTRFGYGRVEGAQPIEVFRAAIDSVRSATSAPARPR